jgi:hypothetical protein
VKVKPRSPVASRDTGYRSSARGGTPLLARFALIALVAALCAVVLYIGSAGFGSAAGGLGKAVGGLIGGVTATPTPQASVAPISDAPTLALPAEPYTADSTADLQVTVPADIVGSPDYRIRVYAALPGQAASPFEDVPLADLPQTVIPVELSTGINDFSVTLVSSGGESEHSAVARYVFDNTPPKITITSPKDGATVNASAVDIVGKTQARSTLVARNADNGSSFTGSAGADGSFSLSVAISAGGNDLQVVATDPAGNQSQASLTVVRGTGKLTAVLTSSAHTVKKDKLPQPVTLSATVTDPDGAPIAGAPITFTLSIPGIPIVTRDTTTDAHGKASFQTMIPKGADAGQGDATVLVSTDEYGSTQDYGVVTIVE